ncbi:adenylate/guanylate cyclase domain-containing protein [Nocardia stercoris]|uniref:Adenylate/guanylate cyclase domain-containing protein n=1 Tax=Nocardia stercoris TaxID=2483361 RepID=A0A3M2L6E1_9NOCA|nr:adenylate/guanylate cyclase domain-containing protein [Nocardia stercoris]RMI33282.1 adenylate/guanylate cyclase domain-containing protein [Nocardia stercoris]
MGQQTPPKTTDRRGNDLIAAVARARAALPGDPAFGDPLSVSGPGAPEAMGRVVAGGSTGVAREIGLGALQLWQAALGRGRGTQEMTILFTDLVSFSTWSLQAGDEKTLDLLRAVAQAIEPPVTANRGRVVKRMGDGMMAVFPTADGAVRAALAGRAALRQVELDGYRPQMRMGLHTGTPREIGGDWLGVDVNIAARMMEAGGNGNTMLSEATVAAAGVDTSPGLGTRAHRATRRHLQPLTGVPADLQIFRLADEHSHLRPVRDDDGVPVAGLCAVL